MTERSGLPGAPRVREDHAVAEHEAARCDPRRGAHAAPPGWHAWDPARHLLTFFGIKAVTFWQVPSLSTILRPVIAELGETYYHRLVAFEASEGTEEDHRDMVRRFGGGFAHGLQTWGDVVATAGWGRLHVHRVDELRCFGEVSVSDPWELTIHRAADPENDLPFLTGKLSGLFGHAFGRTMRARVVAIDDAGPVPRATIRVEPSDATLKAELEALLRREGFTRQERLQFANRQLRETTAELARLNALLTAARDDAESHRAAAEQADRAKSELLASMSHELRTPLNAILGFSEIIRDAHFGPGALSRYREYASDVHRSAAHLLGLIDDLLDLTRIDAGAFEPVREALDAAGEVAGCLRLVAERARDGGIDLEPEVDGPAGPVTVHADRRALKQMVFNLLSNAVKFTPPGGSVRTRVARAPDGTVRITVADTGIGMGTVQQSRLFRPFNRPNDAYVRDIEGTGLGLTLVRSLIDLHGGAIELDSAPGRGTACTLVFPPPG